MQLCEWNTAVKGLRGSSCFTLHWDIGRLAQINRWFERKFYVRPAYAAITYLLISRDLISTEIEEELLVAILSGELGILLDQDVGEHIREIYEST